MTREFRSSIEREKFQNQLAERGIPVNSEVPAVDGFHLNGVDVKTVWEFPGLRHLWKQIRQFNPDWILVSTEDPSQSLLSAALKECPDRVICLAHTVPALPFGPDALLLDASKTDLFRRAAGIVTVSRYLQNYLARWGGMESPVLPILLHGSGPYPDYGSFDKGFVTMVNPCAYKGISIFLALARRLPEVKFAAVPTWGTNEADLRELATCPNIAILQAVEDIDQILSRTRILLTPSLWAEGLPRIPVEAMARGIPVHCQQCRRSARSQARCGLRFARPADRALQCAR